MILPSRITRRQLVAGAAVTAMLPAVARADGTAQQGPIGKVAMQAGRLFGAAVRMDEMTANPAFQAAVLRECNEISPEIALLWNVVAPNPDTLSLAPIDDLCNFARQHRMHLRGHSLLWHLSLPDWVGAQLPDKGWSLIHAHFAAVIPNREDVIREWDVVNEPMDPGHRMDGLRDNIFLRAFGPDYIHRALDEARALTPNARLMVNEFGLDYDIPVERDKRYLLLKLLERLRKADAPLGALGIQAHLDLAKSFSPKVFADFLQSVRDLGLSIVITELDVKEYDYIQSVQRRDEAVGDAVRRYLDVALAEPAVRAVHTWGLSDLYSWLKVTPEDYARYPGAWRNGSGPGLNRGLPLDSSLTPKPMYGAIVESFRRHPTI